MATQDLSEADQAVVDRSQAGSRGGSIGMVVLVAIALVGAAVGLLLVGRGYAAPYILVLLAFLATVGVFSLFALATGILRVSGKEADNPVLKSVADEAVDGLLVTDRRGRVIYANAAYLALTGADGASDVRPVERVFIGDPDVSEAVYRLLKAAREGRVAQEDVRVAGLKGRPVHWLRLRVRPLRNAAADGGLTLWVVVDVTRDRERQENIFQELQHAIDYLDHAPAGFFSVDANGDISYLNATLASWLDHDLAQVGSGGLKLSDIVSGNGAALLTTLAAAPGEVKTEVFDIDFKTRGGRAVPVRLFHKIAYGADGRPGASRTLVLNRARGEATDPQRAAEVRFMRFFQSTPMAIATVDKAGRISRTNTLFARLFQSVLKEGDNRSILSVVSERDREALEAAIRRAAERQSDIAPVDTALAGGDDRWARFYVSAVEDDEPDAETAIVYALETTDQRTLENQVNQRARMESVGQLAGGIAHDFNNVLSAIMMATDFLLNAHKPTDPSFQDIMQIKQNANRAASLVRQLLAFSRRQTLRPQVLDLGEVLTELTMLLRRLIGEKVELERDARPRSVAGEGRHLPIRAGDRQSRGQRARRHAGGRQAHGAHRQRHRRRMRQARLQGHAGRRLCAGRGRRHRHRHPAGDHRQDFRAVLLDQGRRQGHRARPLDGLWHRQADRRLRLSRTRWSARARRSASSCRAMCRARRRRPSDCRKHRRRASPTRSFRSARPPACLRVPT